MGPDLGSTAGGVAKAGFMSNPYVAAGMMGLQAVGGAMQAKEQAKLQKRQMDMQQQQQNFNQQGTMLEAQRQLNGDAFQRQNQNMRAPGASMAANAMAQRLGLGQIIAPPQGQAGFTAAPNVPVQQAQNPMMEQRNKDIEWALKAVNSVRPDGSYAYRDSERNHAQKQILDKFGSKTPGYMNLGQG